MMTDKEYTREYVQLCQLRRISNWIVNGRYVVVLTGAGVSTDCGLPDFRSARGMWKHYPEELASRDGMSNAFDEFTHFYRHRVTQLDQHGPCLVHHILAKWQKRGYIKALITQNVDGFHQEAGSQVIALHGNLNEVRCDTCSKEVSSDVYLTEGQERCDCGGPRRPGVVLFGEALSKEAIERATSEAKKADLFLVLGSSLEVSPANLLPGIAQSVGSSLVIINAEPTKVDDAFDFAIHANLGDTLETLDKMILKYYK